MSRHSGGGAIQNPQRHFHQSDTQSAADEQEQNLATCITCDKARHAHSNTASLLFAQQSSSSK